MKLQVHQSLADIGQAAWDACANSAAAPYNPFVSHAFLSALEDSGSVSARAGWAPRHLSAVDEAGRTLGVMPLYLKSNSYGEYVFDWNWADAYERAGGRYYPKLVAAAPFTPVTAPKFLIAPASDVEAVRRALLGGALTLCEQTGASSLHINFPLEDEWRWMAAEGLLPRQDQQYHWFNRGYATFDDFLADLSSNRRKTIRRERREAQAGLEIGVLTGAEITEAHWDAFFAFYQDTGARKWGRPYLTRAFFSLLGERMGDSVLLLLAKSEGQPIAGALNLIGGDCLYGRYWGALDERPFLHFELCYYQAIDHAIRLGLPRVEAGAQGQHKIARGYLPTPVYSAHWILDPALREPVAHYLEQERRAVQSDMAVLTEEFSPFKAG
ncbi:MAG: GNAT family N-acetyltransferase [Caulobacteraceae bacterium]